MRKILTVDQGNTAAKVSVFEGHECLESLILDRLSVESVVPVLERHRLQGAIYCCVGHNDVRFIESLRMMLESPLLMLTHNVPLPFGVRYTTPSTLGLDRIAAAAGAVGCYPYDLLVADAGTALTLDLIVGGEFLGGNISPGMALRFKALHDFTNALPLVGHRGEVSEFGHDTVTAIRAGVVNGVAAEIRATFEKARDRFPGLRLLLTGGDARIFQPLLNIEDSIIDRDLVGKGLVEIFNYNYNDINA